MKTAKEIGAYGEDLAEKYLKRRGWRILSRNFSVRGGEIDIIAFRFGRLTFFEVKTRSNESFGKPYEAVDYKKLSRLKTARKHFLALYGIGGRVPVFYPFGTEKRKKYFETPIDIIEVYLQKDGGKPIINHIKDWEKQL